MRNHRYQGLRILNNVNSFRAKGIPFKKPIMKSQKYCIEKEWLQKFNFKEMLIILKMISWICKNLLY